MFKYDTSFDTDETYSIRFSSSYNQSYFTAEIEKDDQSFSANFYLNPFEDFLSPNVLIYDYFGSGEMFFNPNFIDTPIVSVSKQTIQNVYTMATTTSSRAEEYAGSVIFKDKDYSQILETIDPLKVPSCWIPPSKHFQNYTLLVSMSQLFNHESSPEQVTSPPVCSHVTYVSPSKEYISDHYQFANMIDGYPSCSHPSFADKHMPCHFFENFSLCPMHESKSEIITQVSVNHANTDNSTVFSVRKVHLSNMEYSYSVFNNTENQTVFNVTVPPETPELEVSSHVTQLLEELLDSYKEDTIQVLPDSLHPESKQPFIASALS